MLQTPKHFIFTSMWNLHHRFKSLYCLSPFFVLRKPPSFVLRDWCCHVSHMLSVASSRTCRNEKHPQVFSSSMTGDPPGGPSRPAVRLIGEWTLRPPAELDWILPYLIYSGPNRAVFITSFECKKGNQIIVGASKMTHFPVPDILLRKSVVCRCTRILKIVHVKMASFMANISF